MKIALTIIVNSTDVMRVYWLSCLGTFGLNDFFSLLLSSLRSNGKRFFIKYTEVCLKDGGVWMRKNNIVYWFQDAEDALAK